jgi:hypothetical protein
MYMPTAVESKFSGFIDAFLKLDGIEGRHEQGALADAFLKLDTDFSNVAGASADSF